MLLYYLRPITSKAQVQFNSAFPTLLYSVASVHLCIALLDELRSEF